MEEEVAQELSRLVEIKSESGREHEILAYLDDKKAGPMQGTSFRVAFRA